MRLYRYRYAPLLWLGVVFLCAWVGHAADDGGASASGGSGSFVKTFREGFKDLLGASRNQEFLQTQLSGDRLEGLKAHLGRDVSNRVPGLAAAEGKTLKELLEQNPNIATEYPQILTYLASVQKKQGVRLFADDRAAEPLAITNPGRVIPSADLSQFGSGDTEERFRDYLKSNFGLDDNQVKAYGAFLRYASGSSADPGNPGGAQFSRLLDRSSGNGNGGLYLPSRELLSNMSQVMSFYQDFVKNPDADPSTFKGADGRSLAELTAEYEPDPNKRRSLDDLRNMSADDVKSQIMALLGGMAQRDVEGPNKVLFDMGLAWVAPPDAQGARASRGSRSSGDKKQNGVLGNGKIREMNEALYKSLILDDLTGNQRDQIELESEGEFFAIRGRPGDIRQKHYDPPIDVEGLLFGAGMNLDNRGDSQAP